MASRQRIGLLLIVFFISQQQELALAGVMDNFNDGLKMAGQMFGINTAADVANLVAKAFSSGGGGSTSSNRRKPDLMNILQHGFQQNQYNSEEEEDQKVEQDQSAQQAEPENAQETPPMERPSANRPSEFNSGQMLSNMLRMVGFDARKLGALAINALVMIAQAIGSTLMQATRGGGGNASTGPEALYEPSEHQPRSLPLGSPIDWFLERPPNGHTKQLLNQIMDSELPERIVDMIESKESSQTGNEAACLKLLMCKSSPIIWGMQKSLKKRLSGISESEMDDYNQGDNSYFNTGVFFKHLPTMDEFREHGSSCEIRYAKHCPRNQTLDRKLK
ncbi:uncharacterized protein Dwil_GK23832 [Drosophila willistoni]|uniref:Uncharacterized protein n=1 Tax=Drosophila willistoni TaxID=7260 RepID=B4N6Y0_DROWI|nr:uncharacterized protein LOC6646514 [Drosophila willistoni]EDW80119.1 uncharacterized protein Dwil_GK23832 [Drosophila willistoni]